MIRDFVSADNSIDLSALNIADVSNVTTTTVTMPPVNGGTTHMYVVSDTYVLAELIDTSDPTIVDEDSSSLRYN